MQHDIIMPVLGMNQDSGVIAAWYKQSGEAVSEGDVLMDIETDKAVMEIEAKHSGFLTNIHYPAGSEVPVGTVVAVIDTESNQSSQPVIAHEQTADRDKAQAAPKENAQSAQAVVGLDMPASVKPLQSENNIIPIQNKQILGSPKAKSLASEHAIPLEKVAQHTKQPLVHAKDVIAYIQSRESKMASGISAVANQCILTLQVKSQPLIDCQQWLLTQDNQSLKLGHLVAFLVVDKLQRFNLLSKEEKPHIQIDTWYEDDFQTSFYQHDAQIRFSSITCFEDGRADTDIVLIDMGDSTLVDLSFTSVSKPMITMRLMQDVYSIKILGFDEKQYKDMINVCQSLSNALAQPLLNLA